MKPNRSVPARVQVRDHATGIRVDVPADGTLDERGGRLVIPASRTSIDDDLVRSLRDAGQK